MLSKQNRYTAKFRTQAISLLREAGGPASTVANEIGINVTTLYTWLSNSTNKPHKKSSNDAFSLENKRLKKALAQAEPERDILKKACKAMRALFANISANS